MTAPTIKTNEIRDLAASEIELACGGAAVAGLSVANQTPIALKQELTAAYLAHATYDWGSHWG